MEREEKSSRLTGRAHDLHGRGFSIRTFMILSFRPERIKREVIMLSERPIRIEKINPLDRDKEILRTAIIAELDAVNLYEQLADMTDNKGLRKVLLDIAREEKTHIGEFQALLLREDREQQQELEEGKKEVNRITGQ